MFAITTALVVASLLCLAIGSTRKYSIWPVAVLAMLHPVFFLALLIIGGAVLIYLYRRSKV